MTTSATTATGPTPTGPLTVDEVMQRLADAAERARDRATERGDAELAALIDEAAQELQPGAANHPDVYGQDRALPPIIAELLGTTIR